MRMLKIAPNTRIVSGGRVGGRVTNVIRVEKAPWEVFWNTWNTVSFGH